MKENMIVAGCTCPHCTEERTWPSRRVPAFPVDPALLRESWTQALKLMLEKSNNPKPSMWIALLESLRSRWATLLEFLCSPSN